MECQIGQVILSGTEDVKIRLDRWEVLKADQPIKILSTTIVKQRQADKVVLLISSPIFYDDWSP